MRCAYIWHSSADINAGMWQQSNLELVKKMQLSKHYLFLRRGVLSKGGGERGHRCHTHLLQKLIPTMCLKIERVIINCAKSRHESTLKDGHCRVMCSLTITIDVGVTCPNVSIAIKLNTT